MYLRPQILVSSSTTTITYNIAAVLQYSPDTGYDDERQNDVRGQGEAEHGRSQLVHHYEVLRRSQPLGDRRVSDSCWEKREEQSEGVVNCEVLTEFCQTHERREESDVQILAVDHVKSPYDDQVSEEKLHR